MTWPDFIFTKCSLLVIFKYYLFEVTYLIFFIILNLKEYKNTINISRFVLPEGLFSKIFIIYPVDIFSCLIVFMYDLNF